MRIQQTMRRIVQHTVSVLAKRTAVVAAGVIVVSGGIIGTQSFLGTLPTSYASTPPDSCFSVFNGKITDYYDNEGDNPANPACPRAIDIPATINGSPVTVIDYFAFQEKNLTAVTIPSSVTEIKGYAFDGNQLTTIVIPDSATTLGSGVFHNNHLTSVSLPANLSAIGTFTFANNLLTSVSLPATVTTIDNYAFSGNQINSISLPDGLLTLGDAAFQNNHLTSVAIPDAITTLNNSVFYNNQLTSITIPSTVTTIGDYTFANNSIETITLPSSLASIGEYAFSNNQLTSIEIPASTTTIHDGAFWYNYLTTLTIPDSVASLGVSAFSVNNLTSLTLGSGLTTIADETFSINKLESVVIPDTITSVNPSAFILQSPWGRAIDDSSDPAHDLWHGDQDVVNTVYDNLWLTQLYTSDTTSIQSSLIPEDWYMGEDFNNDGTTSNVIGGYIVNPANVEVRHRTAAGVDVAPAGVLTGKKIDGTPLSNYLANSLVSPVLADPTAPTASEQQAIDDTLSVFFRKGQTVSLSAPTVTGYQLTSPGSPVNVSLPSTGNIFTFTYAPIPEQPAVSTPTPVPAPAPAKRTVTAAPRTSTNETVSVPSSPDTSRSSIQFADPAGSANGPTDDIPDNVTDLFKSSTVSVDESLPCHNISSASLLSPTSFDAPETSATVLGGAALTVECSEASGKGSATLTLNEALSDIGDIRVYQPITSGRAIDVTKQVTLRAFITDGSAKTVLTYPLQDGAELDTDGTANRSITSQLYLVRLAKASTSTANTQQQTAPKATTPSWMLFALIAGIVLLVGGSITLYRRR